jgi:hypothetical protein
MTTREGRVHTFTVRLFSLRGLLFLIMGLAATSQSLGDILSGLALPHQLGRSLSTGQLVRFSSAGLKNSDWRRGRLRQCIDGPRAEQAAGAASLGRRSNDAFTLGRRIKEPVTLRIPSKLLHEKTIGQIRSKSFGRYSNFDDFWQAAGTGTRGKFFESQSVLQANAALQKQGSAYRYAITAVEGDPGHPADVVLLSENRKIVARYQLKSTSNVDDIIKFSQDPKYADMPIVSHPETITQLRERLASEVQRASRRGTPLAAKWQAAQSNLDRGLITDKLVEGKPVGSYKATAENAKKFRVFQWRQRPADARAARRMSGTVTKSVAVPKTLSKVGISFAKVATGTLIVLEVISAPLDLGFAAYGYYDTVSRYSRGDLDRDLLAAKLAIHTTEAALGGAAVYSLGVGLELIAAPEPIVTKVIGVVVVVGSVVVITADMAINSVISQRDYARQQTLEALTSGERRLAIHADLLGRMRAALEAATPVAK